MKLVKRLAVGAGVAAAALVLSAGPASAGHRHDHNGNTNVGLLNGNSLEIPVHIPINFCGNGIAILGITSTSATCVNDD
ncbi:chaplin [Actinoplanes sp. NPDC051346]|uniref:chaplin n=1 Tax=Actinoplanes sp. NPDC051346 TaxID=3155048 RepID=UPI003427200A